MGGKILIRQNGIWSSKNWLLDHHDRDSNFLINDPVIWYVSWLWYNSIIQLTLSISNSQGTREFVRDRERKIGFSLYKGTEALVRDREKFEIEGVRDRESQLSYKAYSYNVRQLSVFKSSWPPPLIKCLNSWKWSSTWHQPSQNISSVYVYIHSKIKVIKIIYREINKIENTTSFSLNMFCRLNQLLQ